MEKSLPRAKVTSGVTGFDEILDGGLPCGRLFLVEGRPGTGKTTLALQFLLEGVRLGERALYVTLSETRDEINEVAASHGWSLEGITLFELQALEERLNREQEYTVFHPEEVELGETTSRIYAEVERLQPQRVVFDSVSEMRLLARDPLRFRRQILALKQFFAGRWCTALLLDDQTAQGNDLQLQSICHGVILLEKLFSDFGAPRRKVSITKMRGVGFRDGQHDMTIGTGGLVMYPRLVAAHTRTSFPPSTLTSGLAELDELLGGGLDRGTSALVLGPVGCGKSSVAVLFAYHAAERGEHSSLYLFEESMTTFLQRAAGMGMDLQEHIGSGMMKVQQIDPAELSPGEFCALVRRSVDQDDARVVVIDSLNGYLTAMPSEQMLILQMHELLIYLGQRQTVTLMTVAQHGMVGQMQSPVDLSYLADTVILLRFFEYAGALKQAISVIKKRTGPHERTIREMRLTNHGPQVSEVLRDFRGVMSGIPHYTGTGEPLAKGKESKIQ